MANEHGYSLCCRRVAGNNPRAYSIVCLLVHPPLPIFLLNRYHFIISLSAVKNGTVQQARPFSASALTGARRKRVNCILWTRPIHQQYHDTEYGFPISSDSGLLERLALEIGQAGLSWGTILKKKDGYRRAFEGFDLDRVAAYGEKEEARLLTDAGIVRNRLKVRHDADCPVYDKIVALRPSWLNVKENAERAALVD